MSVFNILEKKEPYKKKDKVKARKGRVKVYATIAKALSQGYAGQIFSTKGADRLYVISKAGWGKKSSGLIAKGFTPGSSTPGSDWKNIKSHSMRTALKHGTTKSKRLMNKYGPGAEDKIANSKSKVKEETDEVQKAKDDARKQAAAHLDRKKRLAAIDKYYSDPRNAPINTGKPKGAETGKYERQWRVAHAKREAQRKAAVYLKRKKEAERGKKKDD